MTGGPAYQVGPLLFYPFPMLKFLDSRFEELLGALLLAVMVSVAFINVIVRYCTNLSFSASEELTVNFFVWVVLLGASRSFREGSNFSMSLLYSACPKSVRRWLYLLSVFCCIFFFGWLSWLGMIEVWDEYELNVASESLDIPVWLYTVATPLFSALTIFRILQKTVSDFRRGCY